MCHPCLFLLYIIQYLSLKPYATIFSVLTHPDRLLPELIAMNTSGLGHGRLCLEVSVSHHFTVQKCSLGPHTLNQLRQSPSQTPEMSCTTGYRDLFLVLYSQLFFRKNKHQFFLVLTHKKKRDPGLSVWGKCKVHQTKKQEQFVARSVHSYPFCVMYMNYFF